MEKEASWKEISRIISRLTCGVTKFSGHSHEEDEDNSRRAKENEERSMGVLPASSSNGGSNWHTPVQSWKSNETTQSSGTRRRESNGVSSPSIAYGKVRDEKVIMGNILKRSNGRSPGSKISAEALKELGNERYKEGKFKEALIMYDQAIALDAGQANYRSNRSAALIGLGRLLEAVSECKEAVRIDPAHERAHSRLASLYIRLGEPDKALNHYHYAATTTVPELISGAEEVKKCLKRCKDFCLANEWNNLLSETDYAISLGIDSSPPVYAMKAEALLRMRRYQDSFEAYAKSPRLGVQSCAKLFGRRATSHILTVEALVYLTAGRFDAASGSAEEATCIDPSNKEAIVAARIVKGIVDASYTGDLQFNASNFLEACVMYSEGLIHDPYNPVLLCNRAACFVKLKLFQKAMDDYTRALIVQPNYSEARRRRADCCVEMEKWEAAIKDYVLLENKK